MFAGNPNLRAAGDKIELSLEQLEEYIKCKEDILYFADNYYTVKGVDDGNVLFKPREYQRKILKALAEPPDPKKKNFILLAPRQTGKTTVIGCYIAHHVLFNNDKECALLSFKEAGAIEILDRIKLGIENLPIWLSQGITPDGWNRKSLKFENGSSITAAGTSKHSISGRSLSIIYADEYGLVAPNIAQAFKNGIFPVISSSVSGRILISSTPKGQNFFYEDWLNAKAGKSNFYPMRIAWNAPGIYPVRDEKFREEVIKSEGIKHWEQEYNCSFVGSTCTLIDGHYIEKITPVDPIEFRQKDCLRIYEKPVKGAYYIMGVDTSLGVGRDYSVLQILRIHAARKIQQVAVFRSNTHGIPDFAQLSVELSKWYNNCPMMVENNAEGAKTAYVIWNELEHDTLVNVAASERGIKSTNALGIRSTKKTKIAALVGLKEYVENDWLTIVDKDTRDELFKFEEQENGSYSASEGHDDTIMALAWAVYYFYTNRADFPGADELDIHQIDEENRVEENWTFTPFIKVSSSLYDDPEITDFLNGNF